MRISDWSSDVCSSDLFAIVFVLIVAPSYLTPLMIVRSFGDEVWKLVVNELAFSVGMMLGGILIAVWGGTKNRVVMIVIASFVFGVLSIGLDRQSVGWGKSVSVRVDLGGRRIIK